MISRDPHAGLRRKPPNNSPVSTGRRPPFRRLRQTGSRHRPPERCVRCRRSSSRRSVRRPDRPLPHTPDRPRCLPRPKQRLRARKNVRNGVRSSRRHPLASRTAVPAEFHDVRSSGSFSSSASTVSEYSPRYQPPSPLPVCTAFCQSIPTARRTKRPPFASPSVSEKRSESADQ